jgi:hypothetical protein
LRKADDSSLTHDQYRKVRKEAEKLLAEADAIGRFPTPIGDLLSAANVVVAPEDALDEGFLRKLRRKASSALKQAISKVLGIFDATARLIFIDRTLGQTKQTFIQLHETGHGVLPWQRDLYAVVEDCKQTLDPDIAEAFDREANNFATEVLFQLDGFITQAKDHSFGLKIPLNLSKKFGASAYSSIRQYVTKNDRPCAVIVLNPPEMVPMDGFRASLRRVVASPSFISKFGELNLPDFFTPDDKIGAMIPVGKRRMTGPRELMLTDRNGTKYDCLAEAFKHPYNVFILIYPTKALTKATFIITR